jgi:hypothetical protein
VDGGEEIGDDLWALGFMIPSFRQAFARFDDEPGIELLALTCTMKAAPAAESSIGYRRLRQPRQRRSA